MPAPIIHWFRRDLRLTDNPGLRAAVDQAEEVVPVYVVSAWKNEHHWTGPKRQHFLCGCLESLAKNLEAAGGKLVIRHEPQVPALIELAHECQASAIHASKAADPYGRQIEDQLHAACEDEGLELRLFDDHWLVHPEALETGGGDPYKVYTPYSKKWFGTDWPQPQAAVRKLHTRHNLRSEELPTLAHWGWGECEDECRHLPKPGEKAARSRLREFLKSDSNGIYAYADQRNPPGLDATSRLSCDLRHGTLSVREVAAKAREKENRARSASSEKGARTWLQEIAWRDFYFQILWHWPEVLDHAFNDDHDDLPWKPARGPHWEAFQKGETGFPIVDAGIRQLLREGWMHNRVRMIVAMFLTKDLHISWRHGEAFFLQHLIDGEIGSNNGGWQWSAGTGADAAPYFRIQNPWLQTRRHDPEGTYIQRHVPELADCNSKLFFEPPEDDNPIAEGYPLPLVDHHEEKEVTLGWFK